ncbi:MAG: extracellular solute-binding protein [Cellulosilyticaceae bacterium]
MRKFKKIMSGLCAGMLCVSMIGCGTDSQQTSASLPEESQAASAAPTKTNPYPDPNKKVNLSFFADCSWLAYDKLEGIIPQEVERLTGVSFDFTKSTDAEQLPLMIASGELPDIIMTGSAARQSELSNSDLCWSYNELIEKYASDWKVPEIEQKINANYSEDGKFYMLKNEFNTVDEIKKSSNIGPNFGQIHVRKDIYEALGSPAIKTKEDFFNLLEKVKTTYKDMIPIVLNTRNTAGLAQLVGYDPGMPKDKAGNLCWNISDPKYREFMATINEMFRKGYIIEENFTYQDESQMFQHIGSGKAFAVTHFAGNDEQTFSSMVNKSVPDASFIQLPLMDSWNYTLGVSGWAGLFISKDCKDPEAAIKLIRWAKEPKNQLVCMTGVENEDWKLDDQGSLILQPRRVKAIEEGRRESDYNELGFLLSATDYLRESLNFYSAATPETKKIFEDATKRANWSNVIDLCYPKTGSDERVIATNLASLDEEFFAKLGTAKSTEEFNSTYDTFIQEADKIGINTLNEYYNNTYKELSDKLGVQ